MKHEKKQETSTLLEMHHEDYSLYISAPKQKQMYEKAVSLVGKENLTCEYRWSEGANLFIGDNDSAVAVVSEAEKQYKSSNMESVFFENTDYMVEVEFDKRINVTDASLVYPVFYEGKDGNQRLTKDTFMQRRKILSFCLNYGNNIGQSNIAIQYIVGKEEKRRIELHFDVMSTKLNYHKDLRELLEDIEREYAMLSLSFLRMTYHTFSVDAEASDTPDLIWWNLFKSIQTEFCSAARMVIDRPHNRLHRTTTYVRADRLKTIPPALERELSEHEHEEHHLYAAEQWELNEDTEENRFLKFALQQTTKRFKELKGRVLHYAKKRDLPQTYEGELIATEEELERLTSAPFLRRVGRFTGLKGENLTLKQATGYSTVYRDWLLLLNTYDLHDGLLNMELKDIAELYEIWCFIKVKNIIFELLGDEVEQYSSNQPLTPDFVTKLQHGKESRVVLKSKDVELAEVIYNAQLGLNGEKNKLSGMGDNVGSLTVEQRPDIVLRLTKHDILTGMKLTYLFDAKYRLEDDMTPPDDAINQMHRYRDAIYYSDTAYRENIDGKPDLKREVIGGYILFPGEEPTDGSIPAYIKSLDAVNIGAFPLRPSVDRSKERSLRAFLSELISLKTPSEVLSGSIPQKGLKYIEDKQKVYLLYGYTKEFDLVIKYNLYYIRAVKEGNGKEVIEGFNNPKYVWVYDSKGNRTVCGVKDSPKFVTDEQLNSLGFPHDNTKKFTDIYIVYSLKPIDEDLISEIERIAENDIAKIKRTRKIQYLPHFIEIDDQQQINNSKDAKSVYRTT